MNQIIYEWCGLEFFVYLAKQSSSSLSLGLAIKQTKFIDNNMCVNKLMSKKLNLNINMILYDYMYTCIKIYL